MKRKKRLIVFSIIVASILLLVILSSAIFSFKYVSVEYRMSTKYLSTYEKDGIIETGDFDYGKNILFVDFDESIKRIEKNYPYVKVINIERKFPNYAVINLLERTPAGRFISDNGYYCVDVDMKILNNVANATEYNTVTAEEKTPIYYIGESYSLEYNKGLTVGDFLEDAKLKHIVSSFYNGVVTTDFVGDAAIALSCISMLESVTIEYEPVFDAIRFDVKFAGSESTAEIYDNPNLEDTVYKIIKLYIENGSKYSEYRSSVDGLITTK